MREITISANIADLRRKKGITQEQLAIALNVSPQAVSKWETNTSQPDMMTLPLIADFFGVSIDYLVGREQISRYTKNALRTRLEHIQDELEDIKKHI